MLPRRMALVSVLVLAALSRAHAQSDASPPPSYLMRLVHVREYENLCVLVRDDGQYHVERETAERTDISEGMLAPADLQRIEHWLSVNELFELSEDRIVRPPNSEHQVQLILSVHRPGHWQNLSFPATASWAGFHDSIVPLVQWLDDTRKVKRRVKLREEDAKNNCLPEHQLELKVRTH